MLLRYWPWRVVLKNAGAGSCLSGTWAFRAYDGSKGRAACFGLSGGFAGVLADSLRVLKIDPAYAEAPVL